MNNNEPNNNVPTPEVDTTPINTVEEPIQPVVENTSATSATPVIENTPVAPVEPAASTPAMTPITPQGGPVMSPVAPKEGPAMTPATANMKKPTGSKAMFFVLLGALVIAVGIAVYFAFFNEDKKTTDNDKTENKVETNKPNTEVEPDDDDVYTTSEIINAWTGTYKSGDNTLRIYSFNQEDEEPFLNFDFEVVYSSIGRYTEEFTINKIEYSDTFFEDEESIIIIRNDDETITVTASNSDSTDALNEASGTYTKQEFTDLGWTGTYKSDNATATIIQLDNDYIICHIEVSELSFIEQSIDEISADELTIESFGDTLKITKTENGIKIEASSDEEDSIYNQVSGEYTK